jgi:hypothetical protein
MNTYRVEQNRSRRESMDGAEPLKVHWASTFAQARAAMLQLANNGRHYAAVFLGQDGECVEETECPVMGEE